MGEITEAEMESRCKELARNLKISILEIITMYDQLEARLDEKVNIGSVAKKFAALMHRIDLMHAEIEVLQAASEQKEA